MKLDHYPAGRAQLRDVPGYALTGSASSHAGPQLYWHELQPDDHLHEVVYKCWSAKRHSERIVGPTTDVAVLVRDHTSPIDIRPMVRSIIEGALASLEAPVFAPDRPIEPPRWREELDQAVTAMLAEVRAANEERWKHLR